MAVTTLFWGAAAVLQFALLQWAVDHLGVAMGLLVPMAGWVGHWAWAVPLLLLVGAFGGALVVPLSALLQHRGQRLLSAGRSIGVQNANENLSVLLMLGVYAALLGLQVDVRVLMLGLGLLVAAVMVLLTLKQRRSGGACK